MKRRQSLTKCIPMGEEWAVVEEQKQYDDGAMAMGATSATALLSKGGVRSRPSTPMRMRTARAITGQLLSGLARTMSKQSVCSSSTAELVEADDSESDADTDADTQIDEDAEDTDDDFDADNGNGNDADEASASTSTRLSHEGDDARQAPLDLELGVAALVLAPRRHRRARRNAIHESMNVGLRRFVNRSLHRTPSCTSLDA